MADENRQVARILTVDGLEERLDRGVDAGGVALVPEKPAAYLVQIVGVSVESYGGKAAVTCDEGSYALTDEGLEILDGLLLDRKPVVVGVGVEEAGRDAEASEVYDLVRGFVNCRSYGRNLFVLD